VLGLDKEIVLMAGDHQKVAESRLRLSRVGIEKVSGYLDQGIAGWASAGLPIEQTSQISVEQLHDLLHEDPKGVQVLDVRRVSEWQAGRLQHAVNKPLDNLTTAFGDLDKSIPVAVYCKGGYRSAIAASLLQRAGFEQVLNLIGGFDAWSACQLPIATDEPLVAST
jgi:hydroxyacylglutathione hydrolase